MGFEGKADSNMNLIRWWGASWVTPLAMNMVFSPGLRKWKLISAFCLGASESDLTETQTTWLKQVIAR